MHTRKFSNKNQNPLSVVPLNDKIKDNNWKTTMKTKLVIKDEGLDNYKEGFMVGVFFGILFSALIAALGVWTAEHNQPVTPATFGSQIGNF
jgi:hypothetical protein